MESPCKIVTVARIAPEKGQKIAIEIAKKLNAAKFDFVWYFVGDGPDMQECLDLVAKYGLSDSCKFVGAKSNPYPYMVGCDIYVSPSFVEADPITIQEALLFHKPIVASNIPAIRESLQNGDLGILCSNSQISDYVNAIISLTQDESKRNTLISKIRKRKSRNFLIKEKIEKLLEIKNEY